MSIELIGWTQGYFAGQPNYYAQYVTTAEQGSGWIDIDINGTLHPYLTICLQALGSNYKSIMEVTAAGMRKK